MNKPQFWIGVDSAADTCTAALFTSPKAKLPTITFENNFDGFSELTAWMKDNSVEVAETLICIEATGVYAEPLLYFLDEAGFNVVLEGAHKIKRAFKTTNKNDPTDSKQIAQYAYRFFDELTRWQPKDAIIEQIRMLLTTREQLVVQLGANKNMRHVLGRKVVQTPAANRIVDETIGYLKAQIKDIEAEIKRLIKGNTTLSQMLTLLISIPGVGLLMSAHLMVITDGFDREISARKLAAFLGICPYEHKSGKSVSKPSKSRGYGPPVMRKLVYLAAMNLKQHTVEFGKYYARKVAQGKPKRLVLNNISNKLLRLICAVIRDQRPYHENYRSFSPISLQNA